MKVDKFGYDTEITTNASHQIELYFSFEKVRSLLLEYIREILEIDLDYKFIKSNNSISVKLFEVIEKLKTEASVDFKEVSFNYTDDVESYLKQNFPDRVVKFNIQKEITTDEVLNVAYCKAKENIMESYSKLFNENTGFANEKLQEALINKKNLIKACKGDVVFFEDYVTAEGNTYEH